MGHAGLLEDFRAQARLHRLLDPRHAGLARAVGSDHPRKGGVPVPDELCEVLALEAGSDHEEGGPQVHRGELRHDLLEVRRTRVRAREHLSLSFGPDHGDLPNPHLVDDGDQRFLVVNRQDGDKGLHRGLHRLLDPA